VVKVNVDDAAGHNSALQPKKEKRKQPVFDVPLTELSRSIVSNVDLKANPDSVDAVDVLRSYLELGSCCSNLEATCIMSTCGSARVVARRTRDLKVQSNNDDRPYRTSFEMRPVGFDTHKLTLDCYAVRELTGDRLIDRIRSMIGPVNHLRST